MYVIIFMYALVLRCDSNYSKYLDSCMSIIYCKRPPDICTKQDELMAPAPASESAGVDWDNCKSRGKTLRRRLFASVVEIDLWARLPEEREVETVGAEARP